MRSIILAAALTCSSVSVYANQCDFEFDGQLKYENKVLQIQMDQDNELTITKDSTLYVNNRTIALTAQEQQWVNQYYTGISKAVPQAANIANDAIALASSAMNEVFSELLGSDSHVMQDLSDKLYDLDQQVQYNFYADDGSIRIDSESFEDGMFMGAAWEREFEDTIEEVVSESIGHVMVALGTQIIFGGGNLDEFERKMEHFGQRIEDKVESQALILERNAKTLCSTLLKVEMAETQLQQSVKQLSNLDVLHMSKENQLM